MDQMPTKQVQLLLIAAQRYHNLHDTRGMPYHLCARKTGGTCELADALESVASAIINGTTQAQPKVTVPTSARTRVKTMGGKPSKGTPADKRLGANKPSAVPTKKK